MYRPVLAADLGELPGSVQRVDDHTRSALKRAGSSTPSSKERRRPAARPQKPPPGSRANAGPLRLPLGRVAAANSARTAHNNWPAWARQVPPQARDRSRSKIQQPDNLFGKLRSGVVGCQAQIGMLGALIRAVDPGEWVISPRRALA